MPIKKEDGDLTTIVNTVHRFVLHTLVCATSSSSFYSPTPQVSNGIWFFHLKRHPYISVRRNMVQDSRII